jgi:hypothetical protein
MIIEVGTFDIDPARVEDAQEFLARVQPVLQGFSRVPDNQWKPH